MHHRYLSLTIVLTLLLGVAPPSKAQSPEQSGVVPFGEKVRTHVDRNASTLLAELSELLTLPNVYPDLASLERNATHIQQMLEARGVSTRLLRLDDAAPVVFGTLDAPGATRTIALYIHYDGQPVDPSAWETGDPFEPALYSDSLAHGGTQIPMPEAHVPVDPDWRLYARGASDDKGPLLAILGALDALRAQDLPPSVNLVFFFEGEEEAGSPHLEQYLQTYRDLLSDIDLWLFCDGPIHQSGKQQLMFGVRGVTGLDITVYGAARPLHSGHYGNWAPNPALMLSQLLASMKDDDGNVLVEGFLDTIEPLSELERAALDNVPHVDATLMEDLQLARAEGDEPYAERLLLPSLNIRGIRSASVGEEARNVVPNIAQASLDIRLVRGCEPEHMIDLVERHIERQGYHIVREDPDENTRRQHLRIARIARQSGYPSARTSMDVPIVRDVIKAAQRAAGDDLVLLPSLGGSLPLYLFTEGLGKPIVICPVVNHDNNQHAEDENVRLGNLLDGIEMLATIFMMDTK
ncbi:MAG: M20/M25/M40 family metallo-hydrolase [Planctomycetota bacterium]